MLLIGSTDYVGFKQAVYDYMSSLLRSNTIKNFTLNIDRDLNDVNKVIVDVSITLFMV